MKKKTTEARTKPGKTVADLTPQVDLVYQALETELGGVEIYSTALQCVQNDQLREEWGTYLEQTRGHVEVLREVCAHLGLDPDRETPGRQIVRHLGKSLVKAMQMAREAATPAAAEVVAAECVTLAEMKDHSNWSLLVELARQGSSGEQLVFQAGYRRVENEEDEHLRRARAWFRELWLDSLALPAQLPPRAEEEEEEDEHAGSERSRSGRGAPFGGRFEPST